ncbi:two component transcriptional regulator, LytTR family [Mucilaginibacter gossypiicola]|uniref:Two component transcriptional regulator, LytTR family n=1 Tax=Mucilaginibacter gossypiicola TaxID=551995 RepID=A0A1H8QN77_9SPHI|nr:response regulator [Mucilaginibacter gossypiicola]SEO55344.1 two component transcriptional regulator, LytTR family [Mucilaginibacter gossypiicola]
MKKIRVLIIDDERAARSEIRRLLAGYPDIEIAGEAVNVDDALKMIQEQKPELLFLDIQMPEKSGFDLLESLEEVPLVIFTTAYDQYALKAFEVSALDYLVKPIREERFEKAIIQARQRLGKTDPTGQIFVKDRQQYHFIQWSSVHLIESMDNYARIFFGDKNVFLKSSLNQLEEKLNSTIFFRINRAQIINRQYIQTITTMDGRLKITISTGAQLEVSERQSAKFRQWAAGK